MVVVIWNCLLSLAFLISSVGFRSTICDRGSPIKLGSFGQGLRREPGGRPCALNMDDRLGVKVPCRVRWRQLRAKGNCTFREGVWRGSRRQTAAPNASKPSEGRPGGGERARQRDTQHPTVARTVMGEGAAGHWSSLLQEISIDPRGAVGSEEETTRIRKSVEKSDLLIRARKRSKGRRAKEEIG